MMADTANKELVVRTLRGPQFDRKLHGGLFDRGTADSYYGRLAEPHWYPNGTGNGGKVTELTQAEIDEYLEGYEWNEQHGDKKDYS